MLLQYSFTACAAGTKLILVFVNTLCSSSFASPIDSSPFASPIDGIAQQAKHESTKKRSRHGGETALDFVELRGLDRLAAQIPCGGICAAAATGREATLVNPPTTGCASSGGGYNTAVVGPRSWCCGRRRGAEIPSAQENPATRAGGEVSVIAEWS